MTIASTLLAATLAAQAMTGVMVADAPVQAPQAIESPAINQAQVRTSIAETFAYKQNTNTVSHYLIAKSYTSAENGRTASWHVVNVKNGLIVKSGSSTMSNGYSTNQFTNVSDLSAGTYEIIYTYFDGSSTHYGTIEFVKSATQITSVTPNPYGVG